MAQLTVVIACYNGAATLARQLEGLADQEGAPAFEVIVADNGSTDSSVALARSFASALDLRVVDASTRRGPGYARNVGVRAARTDRIAFCDADDLVARDWVARVMAALDTHPFIAGRVDVTRLNKASIRSSRHFEQEHSLQTSHTALPLAHAGAGNLAMHKAAFEAVGGFDETLTCLEDTDLCFRIQLAGWPLTFAPDVVVHVSLRTDLRATYAQGYHYGRGQAMLDSRYGPAVPQHRPSEHHRRHRMARLFSSTLAGRVWQLGFLMGHRSAAGRAHTTTKGTRAPYPRLIDDVAMPATARMATTK